MSYEQRQHHPLVIEHRNKGHSTISSPTKTECMDCSWAITREEAKEYSQSGVRPKWMGKGGPRE